MKKRPLSKRGKRIVRAAAAAVLALTAAWILWGNLTIGATHIQITSDAIPQDFDGFRIAQISDLHNAVFGKDNSALVSLLQSEAPDIIVFTGDIVDSNRTNIDAAAAFAQRAVEIAPCYYVTGNHEARLGEEYQELEARLAQLGVIPLRNSAVTLERDGGTIQIAGIDDPDFAGEFSVPDDIIIASEIDSLGAAPGYRILLSHRPEAFYTYLEKGVDLVLSGHAHGGQFRLPFIGGLAAPGQGFNPRFDSGLYQDNGTAMVVSRGIGNSIVPVRFNNRPEVVIVELISG